MTIKEIRDLVEKSVPLIRIGNQFFKKEFILECLDEIPKLQTRKMLGDDPSPIVQLGLILLLEELPQMVQVQVIEHPFERSLKE